MRPMSEQRQRLLKQLEAAWTALGESYAGLRDSQLVEPGVVEDWSVKDILAHVTTWEQEALQHLPLILAGGTPPRYAAQGGIDAFNARATEDGRRVSLAEVLRRREEIHARLLDHVRRLGGWPPAPGTPSLGPVRSCVLVHAAVVLSEVDRNRHACSRALTGAMWRARLRLNTASTCPYRARRCAPLHTAALELTPSAAPRLLAVAKARREHAEPDILR